MKRTCGVFLLLGLACNTNGQALGPWNSFGFAPPARGSGYPNLATALHIHQYWDRVGDFRVVISQHGSNSGDIRVRTAPGLLGIVVRSGQTTFSPYGSLHQSGSLRRTLRVPPGTDPSRMTISATESGWVIVIPRNRP